jgi:hypothetical protein
MRGHRLRLVLPFLEIPEGAIFFFTFEEVFDDKHIYELAQLAIHIGVGN